MTFVVGVIEHLCGHGMALTMWCSCDEHGVALASDHIHSVHGAIGMSMECEDMRALLWHRLCGRAHTHTLAAIAQGKIELFPAWGLIMPKIMTSMNTMKKVSVAAN